MTKRAKRAPYTRERKAEALALARIAGAEVASERSRIPVQTIRRWMDAAGIQPGAELPQDRLEALRDLAEASVTRDLVEGRIRGVQAMTVAGIARRHLSKPQPLADKPTDEKPGWTKQYIDELEALMASYYPGVDLSEIIQVLLNHDRLNGEPAELDDAEEKSGEAVIAEWVATLDALVKEHGSVHAAHEWQRAEDARRLEAQLERNRLNREAYMAAYRESQFDAETKALLAAAEAYLRTTSDDPA